MNPYADIPDDILDELDDFDSQPLWYSSRRADDTYLTGLWNSTSFRRYGQANPDDVIKAHGMVQSFVNAFARDGHYVVAFDKEQKTAGTDLDRRVVTITPAPLLDENIDAAQAGLILTGLAVHEICHPRYGKDTDWAIRRAFPSSQTAMNLSNLLDDVRIERRFVEQYPGYYGVFDPTLQYVADNLRTWSGGEIKPKITDQINLAIAALRFPITAKWTPETLAERDWWQEWGERWAPEDAPRRHVAAIREALEHIVAVGERQPKPKDDERAEGDVAGAGQAGDEDGDARDDADAAGQGQGEADEADGDEDETGGSDGLDASSGEGPDEDEKIDAEGAGSSGDASHDAGESGDAAGNADGGMSDPELGQAADAADTTPASQQMPTCSGSSAVERAARGAGVDSSDIRQAKARAQETLDNAHLYEDDGHGQKVDVARSMKGIRKDKYSRGARAYFRRSDIAARYIRDAILKSRTGHTAVSPYQKRGRLDQRALARVASHDFRLFEKKRAISPGKYRIWLMLDRSGSMDGQDAVQQAQVATSIADATRHLPNIRMAAWAWSSSFRKLYASAGVIKLWETGQPTDQIADSIDLPSGGTPDSIVLRWAHRAIRRELKGAEQPIIFFISDGWGAYDMDDAVREARAAGVLVVSVAFGYLDDERQRLRFGEDWYVPWQNDIIKTARPLARMITRLTGRDQRQRVR